jgi:hypothetical protein
MVSGKRRKRTEDEKMKNKDRNYYSRYVVRSQEDDEYLIGIFYINGEFQPVFGQEFECETYLSRIEAVEAMSYCYSCVQDYREFDIVPVKIHGKDLFTEYKELE